MTHDLRCAAAALALPPETVITGKSAAGLWGVQLARAEDCVQVVVPDSTRIARRAGLNVRRTVVRPHECTPWSEVAVATPLRTTLDLLLDRPLPDAVADLDAVLRAGLVTLPQGVQAAGWDIVFVTAQLLNDPPRMVRTVRAALARRTAP